MDIFDVILSSEVLLVYALPLAFLILAVRVIWLWGRRVLWHLDQIQSQLQYIGSKLNE